jgi:hypothetical protein
MTPRVGRTPSVTGIEAERLEVIGSVFREWGILDPLLGAVMQTRFLIEALRHGESPHLLQGLAFQAYNLALMGEDGDRRRIDALLKRVRDLSSEIATPHAQATWLVTSAACNMWSGRFTDALAPAEEAESLFRDRCTGASWERSFAATIRYGSLE